MDEEPEISASLASDQFILWPARRCRGGTFSGNNRSYDCAGGIPACAHWSGREHRGTGARRVLARHNFGRFEIWERTYASDQGKFVGNIQWSVNRNHGSNRDVYLCYDGEKPSCVNA